MFVKSIFNCSSRNFFAASLNSEETLKEVFGLNKHSSSFGIAEN
jgi:hypothetical protein